MIAPPARPGPSLTLGVTIVALLLTPAAFAAVVSTVTRVTFNTPTALAVDSATGAIYVTDVNVVRVIHPDGAVTEFAPTPAGIDPPGPRLEFGRMGGGIAIEPPGDACREIFIAATEMHYVTKNKLADGRAGVDEFLGYPGMPGYVDYLNQPTALAIDERTYRETGEYFVADTGNHVIRKVTRRLDYDGCRVDSANGRFAGVPFQSGHADGPALDATFNAPRGLAFGPDGSLYVADTGNDAIRRIRDGVVTTVVTGLKSPAGIDVDPGGNVYIAESGNHVIRVLRPDGTLDVLAGVLGQPGYADGEAARFDSPTGLRLAGGALIVADTGNHAIRKINIAPPRRRAAGGK
jgi:DNA-binding beta-propeller fold protein YncE